MRNYVVTYNIDDATNRVNFVVDFENRLQGLGLQKESTNQSTYYGSFGQGPTPQAFLTALHNAVNKLDWQVDDEVTVYYPRATRTNGGNIADIGRHLFKEEGNDFLNHNAIIT